VPQISADKFMDGLLECSKATLNEKVFGSVHGYHGIVAKEPCEKRGGLFSFITRLISVSYNTRRTTIKIPEM
jgi:hypothetical protein